MMMSPSGCCWCSRRALPRISLHPPPPGARTDSGAPPGPRGARGGRVQPPRLRANLDDPDVRGVVDVQRRRRELRGRLEDLRPLAVRYAAIAQLVALDAPLRRDEALRELRLGHL